jgi:hypothetical protein
MAAMSWPLFFVIWIGLSIPAGLIVGRILKERQS